MLYIICMINKSYRVDMKILTIIKNIIVLAALSLSMNAVAGLITFNFESDLSDNEHSVSYLSDGYTLTVEAFRVPGGNVDRDVNRSVLGLGVTSDPQQGRLGTYGGYVDEYLVFSLEGASFDFATILFATLNANSLSATDIAEVSFSDSTSASLSNLNQWTSAEVAANSLTVAANGTGNGFRISEIQLNVIPVPEPSTLLLLSFALFGLAARKKSK